MTSPANPVGLRQVVEALLFATPKPITPRQIANLLNRSNETHGTDFSLFREVADGEIEEVLAKLQVEYATAEPARGVLVQEVAGGFRFGTAPETATWVRQLFDETRPARISQPAMETLAIIAYRQPISRADIEAVRGVAVDGVVTTFLERRLIKLGGRSEAPGRPLLYETTPEFLECFGLKALEELPNADELRQIRLRTAPVPPPDAAADAAAQAAPESAESPSAPEPAPQEASEPAPQADPQPEARAEAETVGGGEIG